MTDSMHSAAKYSIRVDHEVNRVIEHEAKKNGMSPTTQIQDILRTWASDKDSDGMRMSDLKWRLVSEAVEKARQLCREGKFTAELTDRVLREMMRNKDWAEGYADYVGGNPYMSGNPRKTPINQELGYRIREGVGATVSKTNGKSDTTSVVGSIIQSYTPFASFDDTAEWYTAG